MENGRLTVYYRLPFKEHWALRTIKNKINEDLFRIVEKYTYSFIRYIPVS